MCFYCCIWYYMYMDFMKQNEEIYIAEFDVEQPHTILVFKVLWLLMLLCYVEFSMNLLVLLVILFSGAQQFPINVTLLIEFVWISWSCLILAYFYCLIFILVADETSWSANVSTKICSLLCICIADCRAWCDTEGISLFFHCKRLLYFFVWQLKQR